jgi:(R,R)-butanediol dehydrogenase / meso-butanediol dehydrogenase / diacetyl reductase
MTLTKAGLYLSDKELTVGQLELSDLQPGEALVKVSYAGICGTDMMIYFGKHPRARAPLAMGHEFSGIIERINGDSNLTPGDRVVIEPTLSCGRCQACLAGESHVCKTLKLIGIDTHGGFAEYAVVPLDRLHRIPDELPDNHAALAEPVAVAVHTIKRSRLKLGDSIAILGAGPIGLLLGVVAKQAGAGQVMISDISPYRLGIAEQLGLIALNAQALSVTEEVLKRTGGNGADIVFEAAGSQMTANQMIECVKTQGQLVVVSVYKQAPTINLAAMHYRELSLITTRCYSSEDFVTAIELLSNRSIDVGPLISHELPLDQFEEGFHLMEDPNVSMKVLFHP